MRRNNNVDRRVKKMLEESNLRVGDVIQKNLKKGNGKKGNDYYFEWGYNEALRHVLRKEAK